MSDGNCVLTHGHLDDGRPRYKRADVGLLCVSHRDRLDADASEIGMLWCELNLIIDGSAPREQAEKTRHLKSAEAPAPLDLTAGALRDPRSSTIRLPEDQSEPIPAVSHIVASWLLMLAEERPITETLPRGVVAQLGLLARHHDWIAAQLWVDDYILELREIRKALAGAVRDSTQRRIGTCDLPTETAVCGGSLLAENGSGVIRCARCHSQWITPQEQARLSVRLDTA